MSFSESYIKTNDNLSLYVRDYSSANTTTPPILCLHGLTRNGDDFIPLIKTLGEKHGFGQHRFIVPDIRGRGNSDYDSNPQNYTPETYVEDCWKILDTLNIEQCLIIGTSLGGIVSMHMHQDRPERVTGVLLNDIGPTLSQLGLAYILSYLGKNMVEENWETATEATKQRLISEYPDFTIEQWQEVAQRTYAPTETGQLRQRYDENIRLPVMEAVSNNVEVDLWPHFEQIKNKPLLCLRGELSRLLTDDVTMEMQKRNLHCDIANIPTRGHVPILDEDEVITAVTHWLAN